MAEKGSRLAAAATGLYEALVAGGLKLACAESCTGGLVAATITDISGSSAALWGGIVSYSNECKTALLGVKAATLEAHGAVSLEVAAEMAEGALAASRGEADLSLAITGIAGPEGGSEEKPVGTVCFAWRSRSGTGSEARELFRGDRAAVREAAAIRAMEGAQKLASELCPRRV